MPQIDEMPYFMTNDEWYEQRPNENGTYELVLTEKAPDLARLSYDEYMEKYQKIEEKDSPVLDDEEGQANILFGF